MIPFKTMSSSGFSVTSLTAKGSNGFNMITLQASLSGTFLLEKGCREPVLGCCNVISLETKSSNSIRKIPLNTKNPNAVKVISLKTGQELQWRQRDSTEETELQWQRDFC